jgi:ABC-type branched-subunit amino acid transport system ATPase component
MAASTAPVISVKEMSTGYAGQPVVHDLSFDVMPGEVFCLLGPNGAGKTTTMLALAGELPLISGEVDFAGVKSNAPLFRRARNGMSVEQHAHKALKYTDHAIVMRRGRVGLDLTGEEARTRIGEVEQAYLTSTEGDAADLAAEEGHVAENNRAAT